MNWNKISCIPCNKRRIVKNRAYNTMVRPAMLYGADLGNNKVTMVTEVDVAQMKMVMYGGTRMERENKRKCERDSSV